MICCVADRTAMIGFVNLSNQITLDKIKPGNKDHPEVIRVIAFLNLSLKL